MARRIGQLAFELKTWGGRRRGAGRKPNGQRAGVSHAPRAAFDSLRALHLTLRVRDHVWNLRSQRCFRPIQQALARVNGLGDVHVIEYSVQGNHIHLIVEAQSTASLASGINGLSARLAKALNRVMGRTGPVFADRYHAHVLRSPTEARNALAYVLGNFASHARRQRRADPDAFQDPFASAVIDGRCAGALADAVAPIVPPRSWALRQALSDLALSR